MNPQVGANFLRAFPGFSAFDGKISTGQKSSQSIDQIFRFPIAVLIERRLHATNSLHIVIKFDTNVSTLAYSTRKGIFAC